MTATSGYYLFASEGGLFGCGEPYNRGMANEQLNAPVTAIVVQFCFAMTAIEASWRTIDYARNLTLR
ncbi:MAG: hypothetical protein ACLPVY_23960 [Acidimicrobiia bacterium]